MSKPINPTTKEIEEGVSYLSAIKFERGDPGDIYQQVRGEASKAVWSFAAPGCFEFKAVDGTSILKISRCKFWPAQFSILQADRRVGTITTRRILRTKYEIDLENGVCWTFWMPLFTVHFWGESSDGQSLWAVVGPMTKTRLNILFKKGAESPALLCALAFIHRRYWRN